MPRRARAPRRPAAATDALVARLFDYGESSAVAALLTADLGAVRALAKGARRVNNGFAGPLDLGVLYRVRIARRGPDGLALLAASTAREAFPRVRRDPLRFHAAALFLEVAADLMRENEPHAELFRLTVFSLKALDRAPESRVALLATFFLARAVALSGHAPHLDACVACGGPAQEGERLLLDRQQGGVRHRACGGDAGDPLAPAVREAAVRLQTLSAARALDLELDGRVLAALRSLLVEWIQGALERRFLAANPLERELARRGPPSGTIRSGRTPPRP